MQQTKVDALQKISASIDVPRLHAFLGLQNYYHQFVKNFSLIAKPLTILTSKVQPWTWGHEQQHTFEILKQRLGAVLVLQRLDVSKSFQLHTNWSLLDLEAILNQKIDFDQECVVAYALQSNNIADTNYLSYKEKTLATVWAIAHFWQYIYGQCFTLLIDH